MYFQETLSLLSRTCNPATGYDVNRHRANGGGPWQWQRLHLLAWTSSFSTRYCGRLQLTMRSNACVLWTTIGHKIHDPLPWMILQLKASLSKSSVEEVHDPALPLCWKGNGPFKSLDDLNKEFKSRMSLNFGNGVTMTIPPENYLITTVNPWVCWLERQSIEAKENTWTIAIIFMFFGRNKGARAWASWGRQT